MIVAHDKKSNALMMWYYGEDGRVYFTGEQRDGVFMRPFVSYNGRTLTEVREGIDLQYGRRAEFIIHDDGET